MQCYTTYLVTIFFICLVRCDKSQLKSVPTVVKVFENESVLLPCHTHSSETIKSIKWYREEELIGDTSTPFNPIPDKYKWHQNGSLEVTRVTSGDTGDYTCEELQEYLDKSKHGMIYFSLGSNVQSQHLPQHILDTFLDVFSQLPYDVLWKFETEHLPGKPDNVRIEKWLPQNDLLGHKNIKLFIMQGGLQSMEEGIQNGVPFLVIPFIGDQPYNSERVKALGMGLSIRLTEISREEFKDKVQTIIRDPSFKRNVLKIRELINDEPMSSMDKAVWWVEHVIRHKGATHLRSPSADVSWGEFLMLDVVAVGLAGGLAIVGGFVLVIRCIVRCFSVKGKRKKD